MRKARVPSLSGRVATKNGETYLKEPSVRTLRSCRINQTPSLPSGSVNLKALTHRLPIKFLVNIPLGALLGSCVCMMPFDGLRSGPWAGEL